MENFIKSKEKDETRCVNSLRFYGSIIQNLVVFVKITKNLRIKFARAKQ